MTEEIKQIADISEDIKQTLLKDFAENSACVCYEVPEPVVGYFIDEETEYDTMINKDKDPV